jgi:hypothetical protein
MRHQETDENRRKRGIITSSFDLLLCDEKHALTFLALSLPHP